MKKPPMGAGANFSVRVTTAPVSHTSPLLGKGLPPRGGAVRHSSPVPASRPMPAGKIEARASNPFRLH